LLVSGVIYKKTSMRIFFSLIFCLALSFTQAQDNFVEESDPSAIKLLDKVKHEYESHDTHKFNYTLDVEFPGREGENMSGHLIQSGDKFVLEMGDRTIISDNESVWVYLKERNEVQINDADFEEGDELMKPSDLFRMYESGKYVFALNNTTVEKGQAISQIECKPLDKHSEYSKLRLSFIEDTNKIKKIKIFFKDGSRMTMTITGHEAGYKTSDATFAFNAKDYEGVIVEDLRF